MVRASDMHCSAGACPRPGGEEERPPVVAAAQQGESAEELFVAFAALAALAPPLLCDKATKNLDLLRKVGIIITNTTARSQPANCGGGEKKLRTLRRAARGAVVGVVVHAWRVLRGDECVVRASRVVRSDVVCSFAWEVSRRDNCEILQYW